MVWGVGVMTAGTALRPTGSCVMHVRCPDLVPEDTYREVVELLAELSPVVQTLPPSAARVELKEALRYHRVPPQRLGEVLRVRAVSRLGVDVRVGISPSGSRPVRGFLRAQDRELAGHLRLRRRSSSRLGRACTRRVRG